MFYTPQQLFTTSQHFVGACTHCYLPFQRASAQRHTMYLRYIPSPGYDPSAGTLAFPDNLSKAGFFVSRQDRNNYVQIHLSSGNCLDTKLLKVIGKRSTPDHSWKLVKRMVDRVEVFLGGCICWILEDGSDHIRFT